MSAGRRFLIVNADDFGLSAGVNRGIIRAHEDGIVTSASLMVRGPVAEEAAEYGRRSPRLSLGLHLDLGEWVYRDGEWTRLYEVLPAWDGESVLAEICGQVRTFCDLVGRPPTHLDSHQHVHLDEPVRGILSGVASQFMVPLRSCSPLVSYCGDFYGQDDSGCSYPDILSVENLITILSSLPPGATELGCHPGFDDGLETTYRAERAVEVEVLCDPAVRAALDEFRITLCSFATLHKVTA